MAARQWELTILQADFETGESHELFVMAFGPDCRSMSHTQISGNYFACIIEVSTLLLVNWSADEFAVIRLENTEETGDFVRVSILPSDLLYT
jgi:hypothetical protein